MPHSFFTTVTITVYLKENGNKKREGATEKVNKLGTVFKILLFVT